MRLGRLLLVAVVAVIALSGGAGATQPGPVEVRGLTLAVDGGLGSRFGGRVDVTVRFRVVNRGADPVQPTAWIKLESQIGGGARSAPIALGSIAGGDHVDVTKTAGSLLPFGSAHAVVTVRAGDHVTTASASTAVIPWLLLLTVAIALVMAIAARTARRRARPGAPAPTEPRRIDRRNEAVGTHVGASKQ